MNTTSIAGSNKEVDSTTVLTDINIEAIYNRHISTIYKVCYMLLHNPEDAEDAVQTVFMKLMSVHPQFQNTEHEKAWLIVTAQNYCKNILKQSWKRKRVDIERIEEPVSENNSWKKELLQEVFNLKHKYKIVIYLYYYEGYSTKEIGRLLHLNPATVRTRLHIGRKNSK
ncbi:MAG TPA: RNA polymerase sigma factor [Clostridiales bacterium]|nr:RNA polymerase sigma factor [Clostridiales bacterium]